MKTISFINMKGGVGKTTSVVEIATLMATEHGKSVLVIDLDPQTNATLSFIPFTEWEKVKDIGTIADVLGMNRGMSSRNDDFDINKAIIPNVGGISNLDLIPSHLELTFLDLDLGSASAREFILQGQLKNTKKQYDFILIDCPPNLTLAPQNALVVSDYIIVPVVPEVFAAIGLPLLVNRVKSLKKRLPNCNVEFLGVVFTKVKRTTNLHTQQMDAVRKLNAKENIHTFNTVIPETVRISEAVASNKPAVILNKNHDGPEAYRNLVKEILSKI
jgi:chromosome partitioning protein